MKNGLFGITLSLLSHPVFSSELKVGDVLYCSSDLLYYGENVAQANDIKLYKNENFRLRISNHTIKFGSSGYFSESEIPTRELTQWRVIAQDKYSTFELDAYEAEISFYYASANPFGMALIKGSCDTF